VDSIDSLPISYGVGRKVVWSPLFLHDELKALGYRGSKRTVRRFVENRRKIKAYGNDSCIFDPFGRTGRPGRVKL